MITFRKFYFAPSNVHSLVLLHAFPLSSSMWDAAASVISEHAPSFNIFFANFQGFGNAPIQQSWTIAEAIVELHHKLKQEDISEPIIGGLSMGGYAAFEYYRMYPNEVKALILSNTKSEADDEKRRKGREEFAQDVEARGYEAVYERMLPKLISAYSQKKDAGLIAKLKMWIEESTPKAIAAGLRTLAIRNDSTDLLPAISCPTLIITGEDDAIIPDDEMQAMSVKIKGAKFVSFIKSGHLTAVEQPEKWGSVVSSFLNVL